VVKLGLDLHVPLERTLSCMNPQSPPNDIHCGRCSKCRERHDAYLAAGIADTTTYVALQS